MASEQRTRIVQWTTVDPFEKEELRSKEYTCRNDDVSSVICVSTTFFFFSAMVLLLLLGCFSLRFHWSRRREEIEESRVMKKSKTRRKTMGDIDIFVD